ncbi:MAG: hypothetical protein DRR06_00060 [Gammaproteobacteria bacterium]|nr:MAG: hypothetical protein DRR06_00060 [Gammaproteobacteria bacterium]RLA52811.1 MAG: hypothetical protein DRR42_06535 [Gammaproteobacteria bacterium]
MNKTLYLPAVALFSLMLAGCEKPADTGLTAKAQSADGAATVQLETEAQKVSYIMGTNIGSQINKDELDFDMNAFNTGVKDAFTGKEPRLSEEEVQSVIEAFQARINAQQEEALSVVGDANLKEGEAFLAEKAKTEGVVVLESGLLYKVIEVGNGASPTAEDTVEVHYVGTLIDGTEFDSSHKRGVPAQFGVSQVIPAWVEALQLMKEGAKWELYVPPSLAYGPGGTGGPIGPNQTLIFEVELIKASITDGDAQNPED